MSYRKQEPPYTIQVELTEGCNLRCHFCGLNGIRGKDNNYKFMTLSSAEIIATLIEEAGWNPRIEFAMHGEPSMNPNRVSIVKAFRARLPKIHIMMTSNGGGLLSGDVTQNIDSLMKAGLNVLALDDYQNVNIVPRIRKLYQGNYPVWDYPLEKESNPHRRRGRRDHDIVIVEDISIANSGTHATLNNHAGAGAPLNDKGKGKRCAKPFREISIRWDGNVAICCNDWRGTFKISNVLHVESIEEIWNNDEFGAARRYLYHGMRTFAPCQGCDALSYRVGLLPDKFGKEELPKPSVTDKIVIDDAIHRDPYTVPVAREWEK